MCMATTAENDSGESASGNTQKSLKRACDCCRKRKVRCDGESPCGPCRKATIRCAYLQAPKKKGPKGLRSARVLHALRKIDQQSLTLASDNPLSPVVLQDGVNQWYGSSSSSPNPLSHSTIDNANPTSSPGEPVTTGYGYYGPPETQGYAIPSPLPINQSMSHLWPAQSSRPQHYYAPSLEPQPAVPRIPNQRFLPYVQLFFEHLYFIMPVVNEQVYLDPYMYSSTNYMPPETYAFLCAICAATIVQLDAAISVPDMEPLPGRPTSAADMFIEECLRVRREFDYVGNATTVTVMTSFFIFAYYGNKESSEKAWHYLQESISFIENLDMDDENSMLKLDPLEAQWRRRLYWLLFITERAYSIQRRKNCRLHPSIELPLAFESEDPRLLHGFVNLAHLFSAIDDNFVSIWKGSARRKALCSEPWLAETQRSLDTVALSLSDITETARIDISVSREWLHVLAWQMGVSNGLVCDKGQTGTGRLDYPIELARRTVNITERANSLVLDSHGIGMEQKLSDIAGCLADVLHVSSGDTSDTFVQGRQYLHLMLNKLSMMRGKESRYLRPLVAKAGDILDSQVPRGMTALPPASGFRGKVEEDEGNNGRVDHRLQWAA
ncbi:hypothetical protein E4T50_01413 [Aureobasidium sp. EXF-12298]|nr:hypothetical protein E4T50_01413 [Aureobasidium sp. EXF-12298]KAI4766128.1 hypothetical protein E4T51_00977 [Aureobasidium sp. EXF-12344]KAI4783589.1 hypothetical protein E4T52_01511 [Aureobasidium sp. EXF-3400]